MNDSHTAERCLCKMQKKLLHMCVKRQVIEHSLSSGEQKYSEKNTSIKSTTSLIDALANDQLSKMIIYCVAHCSKHTHTEEKNCNFKY